MEQVKELLSQLTENLSEKFQKPENVIFDNADVLDILKVSRRTLQQWRTDGVIGFSQVGSKLYYTQKDISDFIARHYNKAFVK
ncbi:MAG TPA: helix-turn-helix domain-containing protein [Bacteroidia bacterium]|nr:helix-turn-helix domain-containing protein [Bacteroidia bacterium]